jgi:mannosylglucosylglycerate synthase
LTLNRIGILHYASPPIIGGVENTIFHHSLRLIESGFNVDIISGRGERFHPKLNFHLIPEIGSRFSDLSLINESLSKGEITSQFYVLRDYLVDQLLPIFTELDICIVHNVLSLHKNLPLTAALYQLQQKGISPIVAWCHDFAWRDELYIPDLHDGYPWDLLRTPWKGVKYVTVSHHRRQLLSELSPLSPAEIQVVNPGVDLFEFLKLEPLTRNLYNRLNLHQARPLILLPARITRRKNIEFAIRITAEVVDQFPDAAIIITGPPGPHSSKNIAYLNSLNSLVNELGIASNVHFLYQYGDGDQPLYLPDAVVADFFRLADLLLFPSQREGFGIPVLEAGLIRLPIFAADIPPIRESAAGFAHLFDLESEPSRVARAIISSLDEGKKYSFKHKVIEKYSWESIVKDMVIPLLQEVVNGI